MMPTTIFQEIDTLHSEWSRTAKFTRLGWLTRQRMRLDGLASQMAHHIAANGGFVDDQERSCAQKLHEMTQSVDAEGARALNEFKNDAINELVKLFIQG